MPRYKLVVEYDGTPFAGWQRQANAPSVQEALEGAIGRFTGCATRVTCAGRTDTGVHAAHQVIHLDLDRDWRVDTIRDAANAHLRPHPVAVLSAEHVSGSFDARRTAIRRHYRYRILNRRAPPGLDRDRVWHVPRLLDHERMDEAARPLLGRHDFTTFRASECQAASPVRTLERLDISRDGETIWVEAAARSFLHSQVRSLVGSLAQVGAGRWQVGDLQRALDARNRAACGPLAPPQGLTLVGVDYPTGAGDEVGTAK